jgi:RES domain-containing protein
MKIYRLAKKDYIHDFSGEGARLYGGRWNRKGTPCFYASENAALCLLEFTVQYNKEALPHDVVMAEIELPNNLKVTEITSEELPNGWNKIGENYATQRFGTEFFKHFNNIGFKVPSVVSPFGFNYILNPMHKDFPKIKLIGEKEFILDARIKG